MRLRCNLCIEQKNDNAAKKTDILWLRNIRGRDYLVCRFHRGHRGKAAVRERTSPTLLASS